MVSLIKISDAEIDAVIEKRRNAAGAGVQLDVAQILVTVPEGASAAVVAERRERAAGGAAPGPQRRGFRRRRARDFGRQQPRPRRRISGCVPPIACPTCSSPRCSRCSRARSRPSWCAAAPAFTSSSCSTARTGNPFAVDQSRARHILLRPSPELTPEAAARRLLGFKRDILSGTRTFEQLARANSEDASAAQGGDLGWVAPGAFVPEFEEAIAALPVGGISDPVTTRFGLHLIQVVDRRQTTLDAKQLREQARNILREQKFEAAFAEWLRDLRGRAYIELRDPPQ